MQDNVGDMLDQPEKKHFDSHYIRHYITDVLIKYMAPEDKFDYFRKVSKAYGQKKKAKERRVESIITCDQTKKKRSSKTDSRLEEEDDFLEKVEKPYGPRKQMKEVQNFVDRRLKLSSNVTPEVSLTKSRISSRYSI